MVEATDAAGAVTWREIVRLGPDALRDRVGATPDDSWSRHPASLLAVAAAHRAPGTTNPYAAQPYLDAAEALLARDPAASLDALRVLAPVLRSVSLRELGRFGAALQELERAEHALSGATVPITSRVELESCIALEAGLALLLSGRLDEARRLLMRALHVAEDRTSPAVRAEASGGIALVELRIGSMRSADAHLELARDAAAEAGPAGRLGAALARLADVSVAIERGAPGLEDRLADLAAETTGTEYEPLVLATRAALHDGADDGGGDLLQEVRFLLREWDAPSLPEMLHDDGRIALLVQRREAVLARAEVARLTPDAEHSQCPWTWSARLALDGGEPAHAIELTAECLRVGDAHAPRTATRARLVAAAAHAGVGDLRTADDLFADAVGTAAPAGSVRAFGILRRHELALLIDRSRAMDHPAPVLAFLDRVERRYPTNDASAPENLSVRERVVLSRLTAGDTHQRIAFDLSVSPNTIKTQVRSIYRKLGVTTRDGAVQRARHLGLID